MLTKTDTTCLPNPPNMKLGWFMLDLIMYTKVTIRTPQVNTFVVELTCRPRWGGGRMHNRALLFAYCAALTLRVAPPSLTQLRKPTAARGQK